MSELKTVEKQIEIDKPIERVFDYIADMANIPKWMPEDFTSVKAEQQGAPEAGSKFSYVSKSGSARGSWEWKHFERPKRLTWWGPAVSVGPGTVEGQGEYVLTAIDPNRTNLIIRISPKFGGLVKWLAPLARMGLRGKLNPQAKRLKSLIESH